jgi:hypothetical protein
MKCIIKLNNVPNLNLCGILKISLQFSIQKLGPKLCMYMVFGILVG